MPATDHLHRIVPLERFREILGALEAERASLGDVRFLRFAAQACVLTPGDPREIAERIRDTARALDEGSPWYATLSGGARFIVAAALVDGDEDPRFFLGEHKRLHEAFDEHSLPRGGLHETLAILILHLAAGRRLVDLWSLGRMRHLYDEMKDKHWWLTGPDDLPACAALTTVPGEAEAVLEHIERVYQGLHDRGLGRGDRLQTAANLVPLAQVGADDLLARFDALKALIDERDLPLVREHYAALAMLATLDHEPDRVLDTYQGTLRELEFSELFPSPRNDALLAADLTVLDLARFDRQLQAPKDAHAAAAMIERINHYRIAGLVLAGESTAWEGAWQTADVTWPMT